MKNASHYDGQLVTQHSAPASLVNPSAQDYSKSSFLSQATYDFEPESLFLDISVPVQAIRRSAATKIDPEEYTFIDHPRPPQKFPLRPGLKFCGMNANLSILGNNSSLTLARAKSTPAVSQSLKKTFVELPTTVTLSVPRIFSIMRPQSSSKAMASMQRTGSVGADLHVLGEVAGDCSRKTNKMKQLWRHSLLSNCASRSTNVGNTTVACVQSVQREFTWVGGCPV